MELAHPAKRRAAREHLGSAAGLQLRRLVSGKRLKAHLGKRKLAREVLEHALAVEEVVGSRRLVPSGVAHGTGQNAGELLALLGLLLALVGEEHAAHLVELDVLHAAVLVVSDGAQETGNDALAHDRLLGVHRVQKLDGLA